MADKRENEMTVVNGVDFLRGIKGGNSVLIDVESIIKNYSLINLGSLKDGNNLDDIENAFGYSYSGNDSTGIYGPFVSIGIEGYQIQLKMDYRGDRILFRAKFQSTKYSTWKTISFTEYSPG